MAYVPGFEHDLFISYAHVDNLPRAAGEQGWVDLFEYTLKTALAQLLGRSEAFSIWRDRKLAGNDAFDEAISTRIRSSALFLPVLSPGYIESTYCLDELKQFATADDAIWLARLREKRRLLKLEFAAVTQEPEVLRSTAGRRFFGIDSATGHELRYRRTAESDADQRYWTAASDLAYDIATTLKLMRAAMQVASVPPAAAASVASTTPAAATASTATATATATTATATATAAGTTAGAATQLRPLFAMPQMAAASTTAADPNPAALPVSSPGVTTNPAHPIVYLAEVTDDLDESRSEVARALEQRGVIVRPAAPLPRELDDFDARVRADLSGAALSVHLVGELHGKSLAGDTRSMSRLQYDFATETGGPERPRLVWVPPDLDREALKPGTQRDWLQALEEQTGSHPAECLRVGLEELKETLMKRLFTVPDPLPTGAPGSLIYISCEEQDDSEAARIKEELKAARHDVILPARRVAPQIVMSIYDGPPVDRQASKEDVNLEFRNLVVLNGRAGFQPGVLRQLLSRLDGPRPLVQ